MIPHSRRCRCVEQPIDTRVKKAHTRRFFPLCGFWQKPSYLNFGPITFEPARSTLTIQRTGWTLRPDVEMEKIGF